MDRQRTEQGRGPQTAKVPLPTKEELKKIVQEGDSQLTVQWAKGIGEDLASRLTTSQFRNVFSTVRQIEMNWPVRIRQTPEKAKEDDTKASKMAYRQLVLLKPKLAYQASREQRGGAGMATLRDLLGDAIDFVGEERQYFQNLLDFMEAILAYHTANAEQQRGQQGGRHG